MGVYEKAKFWLLFRSWTPATAACTTGSVAALALLGCIIVIGIHIAAVFSTLLALINNKDYTMLIFITKIKILGNSRSTQLKPRLNQIFRKTRYKEVKPTMMET